MPVRQFKCQLCGVDFSDHRERHYCSRYCYFKALGLGVNRANWGTGICQECGGPIVFKRKRDITRKILCGKKCRAKSLARINSVAMLKHGGFTKDRGYDKEWILSEGRCVEKHRAIAERVMGRKLKSFEVVHHINGDKKDNRNCNLLICDKWYHASLHQKMSHLYQVEKFGGTNANGPSTTGPTAG